MNIRFSEEKDIDLLAEMNLHLISDEGHRNNMSISELRQRFSAWLSTNYLAALIEENSSTIGYVLWRDEEEYLYIRQFFIQRTCRGRGLGTIAMKQLQNSFWQGQHLRLEVLCNNSRGLSFWRSLGFNDYCLTLEHKIA